VFKILCQLDKIIDTGENNEVRDRCRRICKSTKRGKDGALTPLIKQLTELALQAELESHLSQDLERNRKNGTTTKTMKSSSGTFAPQGHFFLSVRATRNPKRQKW
jgi:hypothetical protein